MVNPTIRWLYDTDHPLSPSTLTAIRTVWAAGALAVAIACSNNRSLPAASPSLPDQAPQSEHQGAAGGAAGTSQPAARAASQAELPLLARTVNNVVVAGVELGTYNFLGTSLQAVGLQLTSATRAGFLVQLTAVLVPLLSALAGVPISPRIWAAALMALAGTCLVALDGAKPTITADSTSLAAASEMPTTSASSSSSSSGLAAVVAPSSAAVAQQQLLDPSGTITSATSVIHSSGSSGSGGAGAAMEAHSPGVDSSLLTPHLTPAAWPLTSALGGDLGAGSLTHLLPPPAGLLDSAADMGGAGLAASLLAGSLAQATTDLTAAGTSGLEGGSALGATLTQAVVTVAGSV
ncbi:EamA domain-containing protein [Haematococcus lacustris]|uniref:EamA domain-containing protein n=1 Tax=Haematococcus lacustris TaxID=44745 RepID=A0A699Z5F6_HAELA|nr:EamA domain-containing protein [Haematococcus lacustris]